MRIICVDDEQFILKELLTFVTDSEDLDCRFFCNEPQKAVEFSRSHRVDLAILDINLGKANGIDVAGKLIKFNPEIKIIFITGFSFVEEEIKNALGGNVLAVLKKPVAEADIRYYINQTAEKSVQVEIQTFGVFGVKVNGQAVKFLSEKAKELLAFLVHNEGHEVPMEQAICAIWPDKPVDKAKIMYRDSVWKLRRTLENYHIPRLAEFKRGSALFNKEGVLCDLFDLTEGKTETFNGSYMVSYDWSMEKQLDLEKRFL